MGVNEFLIMISFVILAAMFSWFLVGVKGKVWIKLIMLPLVIWYGLVLNSSFGRIYGWPADHNLPEQAYIKSYIVKKPTVDDDGAIYVWIVNRIKVRRPNLFETIMNPGKVFMIEYKGTPRSYKLPYTKNLHKKFQEGFKDGKMFMVLKGKKKKGMFGNMIPFVKKRLEFEVEVKDLTEVLKK